MRLSPEARKLLQELGRIGGQKGGKARAERMTPGQRREAARKAVQVRWARKYANRSIQAYLEGIKELPWVLGVIKSSGVPSEEIIEMMETLRTYGSETRWMALFKRLQPKT